MPLTFFMHGTYLDPMLMRTCCEGPMTGLNDGVVWIGEPVNCAGGGGEGIVLARHTSKEGGGAN